MGNCDFRGYNQSSSDDKKEVVLNNDDNQKKAKYGITRNYVESSDYNDSKKERKTTSKYDKDNIAVNLNDNKDLYLNSKINSNVLGNDQSNYNNYPESKGIVINDNIAHNNFNDIHNQNVNNDFGNNNYNNDNISNDEFAIEVNNDHQNDFIHKKKTEVYQVNHGYKKYVNNIAKKGFGNMVNDQIYAN